MEDPFRYRWWALFGLSLLAFTAYLDVTIVNTAVPFIQTALNAPILELQWVTNIFTFVLSITLIMLGKFADRYGRKRIFYMGVFLFAVAAFGAGFSKNIHFLVACRAIQSLGASAVLIASSALLSSVFPEKERIRAISIYSGVTGSGLMIGPFLGGILIAILDWRWVFWVNLPLIAIGLAACSFSLRGYIHTKPSTRLNWLSLIFLIGGLGALLYGIISGAHDDWHSTRTWIYIGLGIGGITSLFLYDNRSKEPLLDLNIFKTPLLVLATLSCMLAGVVATVFMFFDPLYLRILRHLAPQTIGCLIAIIPAAQVIISFIYNQLEKRMGTANILLFSCFSAFFAVVLHRFIEVDTPLIFLALPFFLLGINWGLSNAGTMAAVHHTVLVPEIAATLGMIFTMWNLSGSLILSISTAVFHMTEIHNSFLPAFHSAIDFNIVFAVLLILSAIAIRTQIKKGKHPPQSNNGAH